jgi:hypothetical protein
MMFRAFSIAAAMAVLIGTSARAQDDASAKLGEAAKKAAGWTSFKFHIDAKVDGGQGREVPPTDGTFEKDKGLHVTAGKFEAIKVGDKTVIKNKEGAWTAPGAPAEGDNKDNGGGDEKKKKGEGKKGGGRGGAAAENPGEAFTGLEAKFTKVTSAADGDNTVYSGELTPQGATDLLGGIVKRGKLEAKGTAKITVDKDGNIVKIEVEGTATGKNKNGDVNLTIHRTTTFSEINTAKVEIPDDAKKALGQP